jgi:hypothetical protein
MMTSTLQTSLQSVYPTISLRIIFFHGVYGLFIKISDRCCTLAIEAVSGGAAAGSAAQRTRQECDGQEFDRTIVA